MPSTAGAAGRSATSVGAGVLLGVGFGGLFDGVVLHQILQWHHMLSSEGCCPTTTVAGLEMNTLADGLFHVVTMILLLVATTMLWHETQVHGVRRSGRQLLGLGLAGWGLFNLIEGVIDHQILGIHHVRAGPNQLAYDVGFLVFGAILLVSGYVLARAGPPDAAIRNG